ncbi:uncharacterized protein LOC144123949 [Amblyomma americanum]
MLPQYRRLSGPGLGSGSSRCALSPTRQFSYMRSSPEPGSGGSRFMEDGKGSTSPRSGRVSVASGATRAVPPSGSTEESSAVRVDDTTLASNASRSTFREEYTSITLPDKPHRSRSIPSSSGTSAPTSSSTSAAISRSSYEGTPKGARLAPDLTSSDADWEVRRLGLYWIRTLTVCCLVCAGAVASAMLLQISISKMEGKESEPPEPWLRLQTSLPYDTSFRIVYVTKKQTTEGRESSSDDWTTRRPPFTFPPQDTSEADQPDTSIKETPATPAETSDTIGETATSELATGASAGNESATDESSTGELTTGELTSGELTTVTSATGESAGDESTGDKSATEKSPTGELTTGELTTSELTTGELTTSELTTGELTSGELTTGELTTSELTTGELTSGELTTVASATGESATDKLSTGELTTSELTSGELTTVASATGESAGDESTTDKSSTGELTTAASATGESIAGELTTTPSSADDSTSGGSTPSESAASTTTAAEATTTESKNSTTEATNAAEQRKRRNADQARLGWKHTQW